MIDNTNLLGDLLARGVIRLRDGVVLHKVPSALPPGFDFGRVEGMLLGAAIGDSLGAPSEGQTPAERSARYGEITDYAAGSRSSGRPVGSPTDDTQLTFWTLKQLIIDNGLIPDNLAKRFCKHRIVGIGSTVKGFLGNYKDQRKPWYKSGLDSLGNGAIMRISPVVVPYLKKPHQSMYADAALATMLTHNAFGNTASCVAFVSMLWSLLSMRSVPEPHWWVNTYCSVAEQLEGNTEYAPRSGWIRRRGALWQFTELAVTSALQRGLSVREACNEWGSGASLFETMPSVLFILARHADNGEEAIVRAVNDTKDNDTVASVVGAAVGALHGPKCLPIRWIRGLTGRTTSADDGEVFRLTLMARRTFGS